MKIVSSILTVIVAAYGLWWFNSSQSSLKSRLSELVQSGTFHTLEARYTPSQIMNSQKRFLLKDNKYKYLDTSLKFYPYLMMEVKYSDENNETNEGMILWDLIQGEMVINTRNWEQTHGFRDCLNAKIDRTEFKLINALANHDGHLDREGLCKILKVENELLDSWIEACRKKKLIVQNGNNFRLHLHAPKMNISPQTQVEDRLVTKSHKRAERFSRIYKESEIQKMAEFAFGNDFSVRNTNNVFLPVYVITVQNPDGTHHTSYWNAINGQQLPLTLMLD